MCTPHYAYIELVGSVGGMGGGVCASTLIKVLITTEYTTVR